MSASPVGLSASWTLRSGLAGLAPLPSQQAVKFCQPPCCLPCALVDAALAFDGGGICPLSLPGELAKQWALWYEMHPLSHVLFLERSDNFSNTLTKWF